MRYIQKAKGKYLIYISTLPADGGYKLMPLELSYIPKMIFTGV